MLSAEQKEARRKGIGGSDVASVLSLPPFGCVLKLWFDKTGVPQDFEELNPNMERGIYLEDIACEIYRKKSGNTIKRMGQRHHSKLHYMLANIDREIVSVTQDGTGVLEVKCPNKESFLRMKTEGIPEAYLLQGQHYMYVTEKSWMHYMIFCADLWKEDIVPVDRDDALIKLILDSEAHFWNLVTNRIKPDRLDYGDSRCKKCDWRLACWKEEWDEDSFDYEQYDDGYKDNEEEEFVEAMREHKENASIATSANKLADESKKRIIKLIGKDHDKQRTPSGKVAYKWETKEFVNTKAMMKDHPDIVKKYKYKSGSKPFRFYPTKGD
jgi:putative phage-type endonuclease